MFHFKGRSNYIVQFLAQGHKCRDFEPKLESGALDCSAMPLHYVCQHTNYKFKHAEAMHHHQSTRYKEKMTLHLPLTVKVGTKGISKSSAYLSSSASLSLSLSWNHQ